MKYGKSQEVNEWVNDKEEATATGWETEQDKLKAPSVE